MTLVDDCTYQGGPDTAAASAATALPVRAQLRSSIARVCRIPRPRYSTAEERERNAQRLRAIVEPWLGLAEFRLSQSAESPSDHARWKKLLAGAEPLVSLVDPAPALTSVADSVLHLLQALNAAEVEGPSVSEIADHVRMAIRSGILLPGTRLSMSRIASDLGRSVPPDRAELACRDLQTEKLLTFCGSRWWVGEPVDQPDQVAGMIRSYLRAGVYTPDMPLPRTIDLARQLATSATNLSRAWAILRAEGTVVGRTGGRPEVPPAAPFPFDAPDPDALAARLRSLALDDADLSPHVIQGICAQAQKWWRTRTSPAPAALEHAHGYLIAAVLHLLQSTPDTPETHTLLRRAVVLALDPDRVTSSPLWRTACIAVLVGELAQNPRPGSPGQHAKRADLTETPPGPPATEDEMDSVNEPLPPPTSQSGPAPARMARFLTAVRSHRPCGYEEVAADLDVREFTVPGTGDGLNHFFATP